MALVDRIVPLCDLLLGAAYADRVFKDREREAVRETLTELSGAAPTAELERQIAAFDPARFDLAATAHAFLADTPDDRKRVLTLIAAINDVDDEIDFAEDEYLRALGAALELPAEALAGMTIEIEELPGDFAKVRRGPPPPPRPTRRA